jgi:hypothetical protein
MTLAQMALLLVDWTDPGKVVYVTILNADTMVIHEC